MTVTVTDSLATVDQEIAHRLIEGLLFEEIERLRNENAELRRVLAGPESGPQE
jgi:hypothetical protein